MLRKQFGFTLIEVLVVIAIFGILSAVLYANLGEAGAQSRDTERRADLRALQSAIELYKLRHGRYPAGCNGPGEWSGQLGTGYECNENTGIYAAFDGTGQYIIGHEAGINFAPDFITVLPSDARLNGNNSGYVYTTNSQGTVYKLMAFLMVESDGVTEDNEFKSCDIDIDRGNRMCDQVATFNNRPPHCDPSSSIFQSSYAVWGGVADAANATLIERQTEDVVCDIP